jgi:hypothetical protein
MRHGCAEETHGADTLRELRKALEASTADMKASMARQRKQDLHRK